MVNELDELRQRIAELETSEVERQRAEEVLKESEEKYRSLVHNVGLGIFRSTPGPRGRFLEVNPAMRRITGYSRKELLEMEVADLYLYPEERETVLEKVVSAKGKTTRELRIKKKDGAESVVSDTKVPVRNDAGQIMYFDGIIEDITQRKLNEEKIKHLNLTLRAIRNVNQLITKEKNLQNLIRGVCHTLIETRSYNNAWLVLLDETGKPLAHGEAGVGKDFLPMVEKIKLGDFPICGQKALEQSRVVMISEPAAGCSDCPILARCEARAVMTMRLEHGEQIYGLLSATTPPDMATEEAIALFSEVTHDVAFALHDIELEEARRRAVEALAQSEAQMRTTLYSIGDAIIATDANGSVAIMNTVAEQLTGYSEKEARNMPLERVFNIVNEETRRKVESPVKRVFREGVVVGLANHTLLIARDGTERPVADSGSPIFDDDGNITGVVLVFRDQTEWRRAQREIEEARAYAESIIATVLEPLVVLDADLRVVSANRAFYKTFKVSPEETEGQLVYELGNRQWDIPKLRDLLGDILSQKTSVEHFEIERDFPAIGRRVMFLNARLMLREANKPPVILMAMEDITDRRQLEEEERKIERLQSIGTLAGGIAHDFNNLLTGIMGNISLAKRHIEPKSKAEERLLEAEKASYRARDLTQQLLTFAMGGAPVKKTASIAELLEESATFALRGSSIKCEFYFPDDLWLVEVDEGQMNQVITNLVINADQAMPGGGMLEISANNFAIKSRSTLPLPRGNYVEITIKDHGVGIAKEHLNRIFEPFFTTKQRGSGLGLATTYSIIKNHNGHIAAKSELGAGTTFYIYLPASREPISKKQEGSAVQPAFRYRGKILVMDDEEMIREMLNNMLRLAGYEVTLTEDGAEAIEQYIKARESGQPFGIVILDLTVPGGMGGKETIKKLLEIDPNVIAIVSSGYSTDPIMSKFKKYGFSAVVTKPYSARELERTLQRLMMRNRRRAEK